MQLSKTASPKTRAERLIHVQEVEFCVLCLSFSLSLSICIYVPYNDLFLLYGM